MHDIWRVIHIFSAVVWVGGYTMLALFVTPVARRTGDQGRPFMQGLLNTRMIETMITAGVATVVSGLFLYAGEFGELTLTGRSGLWLSIGGAAGILALAIGYSVAARANLEMRRIARAVAVSGAPPTEDQASRMQALQLRLAAVIPYMLGLFTIAVLGMALGG